VCWQKEQPHKPTKPNTLPETIQYKGRKCNSLSKFFHGNYPQPSDVLRGSRCSHSRSCADVGENVKSVDGYSQRSQHVSMIHKRHTHTHTHTSWCRVRTHLLVAYTAICTRWPSGIGACYTRVPQKPSAPRLCYAYAEMYQRSTLEDRWIRRKTSCCSTGSEMPHRCCHLPNKVENRDRMRDISYILLRDARYPPKKAKTAPFLRPRGSGLPLNAWLLGPTWIQSTKSHLKTHPFAHH